VLQQRQLCLAGTPQRPAETNASASATAAAADAASTAADVISTAADAASTAADAIATAADRVQTGLDVTASANSASAASTSASAASASQVSAAASAASAAAVFNDFEDRYYGPHATDAAAQTHVTGLGLTVDQGDLYFNSTANEMRVYDGGAFIAASSAGGASLINYHYTATAAQTAFSGSDDNSNTLSYTVDNLIVTKNGIVLEVGTDYTATDGSTITLSVGAAAGDEINIVAFKSFTTADMVSATNGGVFQGNVDFSAGIDVTGNVTVTGTVDGRDVATDGTKLDGIEAGATADQTGAEIKAAYEAEANTNAFTDAEKTKLAGAAVLTGATFTGAVTATSFSGDGSSLTGIPTPTLTSLGIANHNQITVTAGGAVTATSYAGDGSALTGLGGGFPSGTKMLFGQTTAPTGWTKITTDDDAALRIVSGTVGSGGSSGLSTALATPTVTGTIAGSTGSHTLSTSEMPSHTHPTNVANAGFPGPSLPAAFYDPSYKINITSGATGGGGSHSHSLSATFSGGTAAINVKYVDVIMASKD
jgi:hypothetical protein